MTLTLPNTIVNGQPGDATAVQQNYDAIRTYINTEVIPRDGTVAMTAPLLLPSDPTVALQAATKAYVDASTPVAAVFMYPGTTAPSGYLFCRGQEVSRATYAALFAVCGTSYGAGNGSTTFNLPNFQATVPIGFNSGTNSPSGTAGFFTTGVGERFGTKDASVISHQHDLQNHTHGGVDHLHGVNLNTGTGSANHDHGLSHGLQVMYYGGGGGEWQLRAGDGVTLWAGRQTFYGDQGANHVHNVSGSTGAADRSLTTGGPSSNATSFVGSSGAGLNVQPSLSINFIIKVA